MAKATAKCTCKTCGKTFYRFTNCYNRTKANQWEEWASENITECNECYHKRQLAKREKANIEAAKKAETMNLPKLAGTEKQVAWAETIRMKYMDKINARRAKVSEKAANPETAERAQLQLQNMDKDVAILLSHIDARWWIDNHDWSLKDIMRIVKKAEENEK